MVLHEDERGYWPFIPQCRLIPHELHSLELDGPFQKCMLCDGDLSDVTRKYFIERIFRGTEPIVEYAMCVDCQQGMCAELSEESQRNIQDIFMRVDHDRRLERLQSHIADEGIEAWIDQCIITGTKRRACQGYQIVACCQGPDLLLAVAPFMLSNQAVEQIMKVISRTTRDRLDDFMGDNFGMPPEFCERPEFFPVLM